MTNTIKGASEELARTAGDMGDNGLVACHCGGDPMVYENTPGWLSSITCSQCGHSQRGDDFDKVRVTWNERNAALSTPPTVKPEGRTAYPVADSLVCTSQGADARQAPTASPPPAVTSQSVEKMQERLVEALRGNLTPILHWDQLWKDYNPRNQEEADRLAQRKVDRNAAVDRILAALSQPATSQIVGREAKMLSSLCQWLLHRFGPDTPEGEEATFRLAALAEPASSPPAVEQVRCTMDVGCDEYGVCFAESHGEPDRCPKATPPVPASTVANDGLREIVRPFAEVAAAILAEAPAEAESFALFTDCQRNAYAVSMDELRALSALATTTERGRG